MSLYFTEISFCLKFLETLVCKLSANTLTIETSNGSDFFSADDGYQWVTWNLYFSLDNGIVARADTRNKNAPQLDMFGIDVEGISKIFFTQV